MSSQPFLKTLGPVELAQADARQKEILEHAKKQVGFIPNMYANMVNAPAVLDTYLHGYGLFRSESGLSSAEQEVVLLAVSEANGCSYCTAAHSMLADKKSGVSQEVLQAIRSKTAIPDKKLAALFEFTQEMVQSRGRPDAARLQTFLGAGYQEKDVLYIVLAIAVKTLSNYSNHAFATKVDDVFAAYKVA